MKSKSFLQYQSNTSKYTTSDSYWMQNNPLFDIPFCVQNNLKMIIKIYINIDLYLEVMFYLVVLYWNHESWVHKTRNFVHDTAYIGSTSKSPFLNDNQTFTDDFKLYTKFYRYDWKVLYLLIGPGRGYLIRLDFTVG